MIDTSRIEELVAEMLPIVIDVRRAIHANPEPSGEEFLTTETLASRLREAGLAPRTRTPSTGLTLELGSTGRLVAFRADIDALPVEEPPGFSFASIRQGMMHACGHDAHAAIALGVAMVSAKLDLPGRVRIIFQPAEETFPGGAYDMLREGVTDGVEAIFAFHVDPLLDTGRVGLRSGAITASADRFFITMEGPGGHTARPHQTVDMVYAAGKVVTELPALMDRRLDARTPFVLVFGRIRAGTADNVIPTTADMSGTLRIADPDAREQALVLMERLTHQIVEPLGAKVVFHYQRGIPPVMNDPHVIATLGRAITAGLGSEVVVPANLSMGAEDFARYLEHAPGALLRLGCRLGGLSTDLHSAGFQLDEQCLEVGVKAGVLGLLALMS